MDKQNNLKNDSQNKNSHTAAKVLAGVIGGATLAAAVVLADKKKRAKIKQNLSKFKKTANGKLAEIKEKTNAMPSVKKVKKGLNKLKNKSKSITQGT